MGRRNTRRKRRERGGCNWKNGRKKGEEGRMQRVRR